MEIQGTEEWSAGHEKRVNSLEDKWCRKMGIESSWNNIFYFQIMDLPSGRTLIIMALHLALARFSVGTEE